MALETWEFDTVHSGIHFSVRHMVIAKVRGAFTKWSGNAKIDLENLATSSVDVKIEAASIDTKEPQRDGHLRSPDFFDAEKFPFIEFKSTKVEASSKEHLRVTGDLTLHGVTREVVLETEFAGSGKDPWGGTRVGFSATTHIDRKDFGLTWNQALETGGILVGDRIDITLDVEAKKAS